MKKSIIALGLMGVVGLSNIAVANTNTISINPEYAYDLISEKELNKHRISKKVAGYTVKCYALGDVANSKKHKNTPFDFCLEKNTKLVLDSAKALKEPNFAGELKIIKISPTKEHKPKAFIDYALVAIVDEKDKKIIVNDYAYAVKYPIIDYDKKGNEIIDITPQKRI